jgi:hypothetical protein
MVRHIPRGIKQLLTLRNPDGFACPPISQLNCLFDRTYADARLKGVGTGWVVLAVHIQAYLYDISFFPNRRPDMRANDSKRSIVCRPSVSLRNAFSEGRSELCAQGSPHA